MKLWGHIRQKECIENQTNIYTELEMCATAMQFEF